MAAAPTPTSPSTEKYYFLPHIGIEQLPQPSFTWPAGEDFQKKCTDAAGACMGYTTDGKAFAATALNPNGAKLRVYDESNKGSYFKHKSLFGMACGRMKGTLEGDQCKLNAATARNTIQVLKTQGKVKEAFVGCNCNSNLLLFVGILLVLILLLRK